MGTKRLRFEALRFESFTGFEPLGFPEATALPNVLKFQVGVESRRRLIFGNGVRLRIVNLKNLCFFSKMCANRDN